jgi:hypothetical protein
MHSGTAAGISRDRQHASPFARQARVAALGVGRLLRTTSERVVVPGADDRIRRRWRKSGRR